MTTINKSTQLYNIRTNVGKLINTDLNLKHSKLQPPMQSIKEDIWTGRIPENTDSNMQPLPTTSEEGNPVLVYCISNLFKCIITDK